MTKLPPDDLWNPYQAPISLPAPEQHDASPSAGHVLLKRCVFLQMLVVVVGLALAHWDIHSIIGSGLVLFLVGLITAILSHRRRLPWGVMFGVSGPLLSLLIFGLINLLHWRPGDTQQPVRGMAAVYLVCCGFAAPFLVLQIRAREKRFNRF